jgi:hypothetical protein
MICEHGESFRYAIEARRVFERGGGACALLVIRTGRRIMLLHHGAFDTAADLSPELALDLAEALRTAARIP